MAAPAKTALDERVFAQYQRVVAAKGRFKIANAKLAKLSNQLDADGVKSVETKIEADAKEDAVTTSKISVSLDD